MIAQIDVAIDLPEFNDLGRSVTADLPLMDHFSTNFLLPRGLGTSYRANAYSSR